MKVWGALWVGIAAAACGGTVHEGTDKAGVATPGAGGEHPRDASQGGASGSFAGASSAGGARVGGSPGTGGIGGPTVGGAGGAFVENCTQTKDGVKIAMDPLVTTDGGPFVLEAIDYSIDGRIVATSPSTFEIDTCPSGADCIARITFTVDAPGLDVSSTLAVGALAHVHYKKECIYGCVSDIAVTALASWGGYAYAAPAPTGLYLAADDGGGSVSEMPYAIGRTLLDCPVVKPMPCGANAGLYTLEFDLLDASGGVVSWVIVPMGEERRADYGGGTLRIRNLRSFETGQCDNYTNWAHWVANVPSKQ
jgi:hypothetical protein